MRKANQGKHVFCLEGMWDSNLKDTSTVTPILDLIHRRSNTKFRYIHKDCATPIELEFYLKKWASVSYSDHPILYLAFHGTESCISMPNSDTYSLDDFANILEGKCSNRIIVFASCSTLDIHKTRIKSFIKSTGCLAVCGYKASVGWMKATAFELLLLDTLQENEFSGRGIGALSAKLKSIAKSFRELEFSIVTEKEL